MGRVCEQLTTKVTQINAAFSRSGNKVPTIWANNHLCLSHTAATYEDSIEDLIDSHSDVSSEL